VAHIQEQNVDPADGEYWPLGQAASSENIKAQEKLVQKRVRDKYR